MIHSKDFVPEVAYFPHPVCLFSDIPYIIETPLEVKERMNNWIAGFNVDVVSIETLLFEYGEGLSLPEARFRVWYRGSTIIQYEMTK